MESFKEVHDMNNVFKPIYSAFTIFLMLTLIGVSIQAQNGRDPQNPPPSRNPEFPPGMHRQRQEDQRYEKARKRHDKARDMMLSLKIWKLTEALEINEKLAEKVYPRVRELENLRFQHLNELQKINQELRMTLDEDELKTEALKALVAQVKKLRLQQTAAEVDMLEKIFELLTPEQQAGFILVEADFHQNIRRFLHDRQGGFKDDPDEPEPPM